MQRLIVKIVDATPATQENAEIILGRKINNVTHSSNGYIVDKNWVPAEYVERSSTPYDTEKEVLKTIISDINRHSEWIERVYLDNHNSENARKAIHTLKEYKRLINHLQNKAK